MAKNTFTTKSGKTIKVNRSLTDRMKAGREAKAQRKAAYLSTLPKEPWKRALYRMHPKRLYQYWFSRDGAIMALKVAGIGFVVVFLIIVSLFAYFRKDLPKIKDLNSGDSGGSISYYDRTGKTLLFQDYNDYKRIPVEQDQISKYMQQATVAIEDKDFYHEGAFNVKGIARAAINNAKGGSTQGGSTITQQLVKLNENWSSDRTISRKVKELILAVELEREYSKDEILTGYLNMAPYSGQNYGVQSAAQDYFHVDAKDLTLAQAALLAAMPKAPGTLSPYASPTYNSAASADYFNKPALLSRQAYILDQMAKQGYITQAQADEAKKVDIIAQVQPKPADKYAGIKAPYFYQAARDELAAWFPSNAVKAGGWKVITTLDLDLQNLAEKAVNDNRNLLKRYQADNTAFVAEDNTSGQVVALIGGLDFSSQQLNFASSAPISPGSSIKPYSYATLINSNNNVGAGSMLYDTQGALPGYPCTNKNSPDLKTNPGNCLFDDTRHYYGSVSLRYALGSSLNVPAVKAFTSTDPSDNSTAASGGSWRLPSIKKSMSTINAMMGKSDAYRCFNPGTVLSAATDEDETQCFSGAGIGNEAYTTLANHVNGIGTLARMGDVVPQTYVLKVINNSGKNLWTKPLNPKPKQVIKPDSAYIVNNMAADPKASYLSGSCTDTNCSGYKFHRYKGWQNAIKTGTNEDLDGLMMSWNTKYTAGVWIGNYDRSAYAGSPENVTDPIMKAFMQGAIDRLGDVKPNNWTQPADIKTLPGYRSAIPFSTQSQAPSTDLYPSWYVENKSASTSSQVTDKVSGLTATSCTPTLARQTLGGSTNSSLNVDIYRDGHPNISSGSSSSTNSSQQSYDDVHSCSDAPPTATITAVNGTSTNGNNTPNCPVAGCTVLVHVEQGTHPFNDPRYPSYPGTLNLLVNGQVVQSTFVNDSGDYSLTYSPGGSDGSVQLQAQVVDSVLYQGTDTKTINIKSISALKVPGIPGNSGPGGPGRGRFANFPGN